MATWEDVRQSALALPAATEEASRGDAAWRVKTKTFVWERPLRGGDLAALGDAAPEDTPLAARVADIGVREALIAAAPDVYFTIPHFGDYPAVLIRLDRISPPELDEVVVEAWLAVAPKRLAKEFLGQ